MPLNDFDAFVLTPNTNGTTSTPINSSSPVTLASVTVNATGSTNVLLKATIGLHGLDTFGTFIVSMRKGTVNGPIIFRGRQSWDGVFENGFDTKKFNHVDTNPGSGPTNYFLTIELTDNSAANNEFTVVTGPITFLAEAVS